MATVGEIYRDTVENETLVVKELNSEYVFCDIQDDTGKVVADLQIRLYYFARRVNSNTLQLQTQQNKAK